MELLSSLLCALVIAGKETVFLLCEVCSSVGKRKFTFHTKEGFSVDRLAHFTTGKLLHCDTAGFHSSMTFSVIKGREVAGWSPL